MLSEGALEDAEETSGRRLEVLQENVKCIGLTAFSHGVPWRIQDREMCRLAPILSRPVRPSEEHMANDTDWGSLEEA